MKLCPQCEFIYEDDQTLCDMDGHELVHRSEPSVIAQSAAFSDTSPATLRTRLLVTWQSSSFASAAVAVVILAGVLFVAYYARAHQLQPGTSNQAAAHEDSAPAPSNDSDSVPSASHEQSPSPEQSLEQSSPSSFELTPNDPPSQLPVASPAQKSGTRPRSASSSVSAGGSPAGNRAPAVIRLTNGASIKADEAWERREGIWYRQGGVVTLLKRNRVKEINRQAYSQPRPQPVAIKPEEKKSKPETPIAQDQHRVQTPETAIAKTEPKVGRVENAAVKKESKVTSFLKKTGRILSKPFKF